MWFGNNSGGQLVAGPFRTVDQCNEIRDKIEQSGRAIPVTRCWEDGK
jgi:hypothetical protein